MEEEVKKELESLRSEVQKLKQGISRNCANCACVSRYSCGWTVYECDSGNNYRQFVRKTSSRPTQRAADLPVCTCENKHPYELCPVHHFASASNSASR